MPEHQEIWKILRAAEVAKLVEDGMFLGSADDISDGFIHLSTGAQVAGTLSKHFKANENLFAAKCDTLRADEALKWERSRNGDSFPHLNRPLALGDVEAIFPIDARWRLARSAS